MLANEFVELVILVMATATFYVVGLITLWWVVFNVGDWIKVIGRGAVKIFEVLKSLILHDQWREEIRQQLRDQQEAGDRIIAKIEEEAIREREK